MEEFVALQKELLKEEHEAEIEECTSLKKSLPFSELQNRGICVKKLHILSMKTGLYGRTIIKLGLRGAPDRPLPSHNFSSGDIVDLHLKSAENFSSKPKLQAVVTAVKEFAISAALDGDGARSKADDFHSNDQSLILFKSANQVTYQRLQRGLELLMHHNGVASNLVQVCFGSAKPTAYSQLTEVKKYYNESLNDSQKAAIEFALSQRDLAVIHGPPGTGKTTTIAELISQLVTNGQKVLACTPSNVAIDNILERLSGINIERHSGDGRKSPIKVIRLGHPARMLTPELHRMSLDAVVAKSDAAKIVQDVRKDIDKLYTNFRKKHNRAERNKFREEKKILAQELKDREKKAITEILASTDVVLATNVGAHSNGPLKHLPADHFNVVVIDECGQALESSCWIPILRAPKLILAGDHLQLPPTVKSRIAAAKGLSTSLLQRISELHHDVVCLLNVQYRMNDEIMKWSSDNLYDSKLSAHISVKTHTLNQLPGVLDTDDTSTPLLLIDTAGCDMPELQTEDNESIGNPGEAEVVASHVKSLVEAGVSPKDIAVISPYNMQVDFLRKMLREKYIGLEIKSVDGFQGREKEAVVISLVRSNEKGVVGFLSDNRRMNVAVTRARRHLAVICDSVTVGKHKFLATLVEYISEKGEVRSAHEFTTAADDGLNFHFDALSISKGAKKKSSKPIFVTRPEPNTVKHDLAKVKSEFRNVMDQFVQTGGDSYEFSSTLKAHERLAIHELCEELGLNHESTGGGKDRKIVISVKRVDGTNSNNSEENTGEHIHDKNGDGDSQTNQGAIEMKDAQYLDINEQLSKYEKTFNNQDNSQSSLKEQNGNACDNSQDDVSSKVTCNVCGRKLPPDNIQLHQVHCERLKSMKERLQLNGGGPTAMPKGKKTQKTKNKKSKSNPKTENREKNDEEILNEAIQANNCCSILGCEKFLSVLGRCCPYCKKLFCMEHHMPELHGCGQAAHAAARRQICRDGVLYSGSGTRTKNLPPEKHARLQRKLDSKLKEMEGKRMPACKKK